MAYGYELVTYCLSSHTFFLQTCFTVVSCWMFSPWFSWNNRPMWERTGPCTQRVGTWRTRFVVLDCANAITHTFSRYDHTLFGAQLDTVTLEEWVSVEPAFMYALLCSQKYTPLHLLFLQFKFWSHTKFQVKRMKPFCEFLWILS